MYRFKINETYINNAPIGWDSRNRSVVRNEDAHGMFREFTNDLIFIKDAYVILNGLWDRFGINALAILTIEKFDAKQAVWNIEQVCKFDFTTYTETNENGAGVKISLVDDEFIETFMARKSTDIPYDRLETIDGVEITPFPAHNTFFDSEHSYNDEDGYRTAKIFGIDVADNGVPYVIDENKYSSDDSNRNVIPGITTAYENPSIKDVAGRIFSGAKGTIGACTTSDCFFYSDGYAKVKYDLSLLINHRSELGVVNSWDLSIRLYKLTFNSEVVLLLDGLEILAYVDKNDGPIWNYLFETSGSVDILPNEGLMLYIYHYANNAFFAQSNLFVKLNSRISLDFSEKYIPTYSKTIRPHEAFTRIIESCTGKQNAFYSDYFGRVDLGYEATGEFAQLGLTKGLLLRNFPTGYKIDDDDDSKVAQLTFSFQDLFDSLNCLFCLSYGISVINNELKVVVEPRTSAYGQNVLATVPSMVEKSFSRELIPDFFFNQIEIGCDVESYEELSGLEEYNGKNTYTTIIKSVDNTLELISPYQFNCYAPEYARRKPYPDYSTTDTQYDSNNQIIELILDENGNFIQLTTEGFASIEGIPLVTTPMNLNLTPARSLMRWGWWINTGLWKYPNQKIRFSKSSFATGLKTQKTDETFIVTENGDILNSLLGTPRLTGFMLKFSAPVTDAFWNSVSNVFGGIIGLIDPITKETIFGYRDSITSEPVKNEPTNWQLLEAFPPTVGVDKVLSLYDDSFLITDLNSLIKIT